MGSFLLFVRHSGSDTTTGTVKVASIQKGGKENIIRPKWLFDCIKQNQADTGLSDLILPLEPRSVKDLYRTLLALIFC